MVEITQHVKKWEIASREEKRRAICTSHLLLQVPSLRKHIIKRETTSCSLKLIAVIQVELEVNCLKGMQRGYLENTKWILCLVSMPKLLITVTAKILLSFLFGQHATTLSLIVPHYNSPSRSFKASGKFESIVASYIRLIPAFDLFFLIAKPVSYKVNQPVALKRGELFIISGVWA